MSELIIFDTLGTLLRALICGYATLNTGTYFQRLRFKTTFEMSAFLEYTQDGCREEKVNCTVRQILLSWCQVKIKTKLRDTPKSGNH